MKNTNTSTFLSEKQEAWHQVSAICADSKLNPYGGMFNIRELIEDRARLQQLPRPTMNADIIMRWRAQRRFLMTVRIDFLRGQQRNAQSKPRVILGSTPGNSKQRMHELFVQGEQP